MTATLESLDAKLDRVVDLLGGVNYPTNTELTPAYQHPELSVYGINPDLIDNMEQPQIDGSIWITDKTRGGKLMQLIYGYISESKNPAMWGRLVQAAGGDAALVYRQTDANGPFAIYKVHPDAILLAGDPNWLTVVNQIFAAPVKTVEQYY